MNKRTFEMMNTENERVLKFPIVHKCDVLTNEEVVEEFKILNDKNLKYEIKKEYVGKIGVSHISIIHLIIQKNEQYRPIVDMCMCMPKLEMKEIQRRYEEVIPIKIKKGTEVYEVIKDEFYEIELMNYMCRSTVKKYNYDTISENIVDDSNKMEGLYLGEFASVEITREGTNKPSLKSVLEYMPDNFSRNEKIYITTRRSNLYYDDNEFVIYTTKVWKKNITDKVCMYCEKREYERTLLPCCHTKICRQCLLTIITKMTYTRCLICAKGTTGYIRTTIMV